VVYTLVMGLTGAGKSTFISIATENDTIEVGKDDDMDVGKSSVLNSSQKLILISAR
jgi:predicted kinase